jgi:hypothetical protein
MNMGELEGSTTTIDMGEIKYKVRPVANHFTLFLMSEEYLTIHYLSPEEFKRRILSFCYGNLADAVNIFSIEAARRGLNRFYLTAGDGEVYEVRLE